MTSLILSTALLIVVLYLLLRPVLRPRTEESDGVSDPVLADLYAQKELLYTNIREMEADRQIGKFSDEDFQQFSQRTKEKAAAVLRQIDAYQRGTLPPALDETIEAAIRSRRATPVAGGTPQFCSRCGAPLRPEDQFCSQCGAPVQRETT